MIIFILITIFAIYYIAMIASLFKSEGFFNNRFNIRCCYNGDIDFLLFYRRSLC
ncbi:Uncharacterised protein [Staphylococcus aureus]|nr:Uncharacterised protein [Staphylococcus aureus]